jgi:hypothetical protein
MVGLDLQAQEDFGKLQSLALPILSARMELIDALNSYNAIQKELQILLVKLRKPRLKRAH